MAELIVMPKLGLLMENGVVSAWRAGEGDPVAIGDVIAEITTDKITYELEAQSAGVLLKIVLSEEVEAPVGAPIGVIGQPGEDFSGLLSGVPGGEATFGAGLAPADIDTTGVAGAAPGAAPPSQAAGRIVASPAAKKRAAELGVDLAAVRGSGPGGRISLDDVEAASRVLPSVKTLAEGGAIPPVLQAPLPAAARPTAAGFPGDTTPASVAGTAGAGVFATPLAKKVAAELGVDLGHVQGGGTSGRVLAADVEAFAAAAPGARPGQTAATGSAEPRGGVAQQYPYSGMRKLIGEHMDASRKLAPTVTYTATADVEQLKRQLAAANAGRADDDKVNVTAVTIKAVASTLRRMPRFNASLDGDVIKIWRDVNVGVAVALPDGLIVPVVRHADEKTLTVIAREVRDLARRARENKLLPDEVAGGTFTVTTLGPYRSVEFFDPIINQPEAAILGVGRMQDSVVAIDGAPTVRATMGLSLTCDHRMLDGAPAAEFLRVLMDYLEQPLTIAF